MTEEEAQANLRSLLVMALDEVERHEAAWRVFPDDPEMERNLDFAHRRLASVRETIRRRVPIPRS